MGTNKHATIRYQALDRCFSNTGRRYHIDDLVEACNEALYNHSGIVDGVKKRQVQEDIKFMESEAGWSIPLLKERDGKRIYLRYEDPNFSINKQSLNTAEAIQLKETILMLSRFKGLPNFEWMEDILIRLESSFHLSGRSENVIGFEQNPYLKGLNFFSLLFDAIVNKQLLKVKYRRFGKEAKEYIIHPYYLKQYNSRWFLWGLCEDFKEKYPVTNFPIDRIEAVNLIDGIYIQNTSIDFQEYFEDVVRVSVPVEQQPEKIILQVESMVLPYILTKPLHGSQKLRKPDDGSTVIELCLIPNYEFETLLLSYAHGITVLQPEYLKEKLMGRARQIINRNM